MNDRTVDNSDYLLRNSTLNRTVRAVEKSMGHYGLTRPLTVEYKSYLNNLPRTPERREDEILRQISCSECPKSVHEIADKLSDLYVYSNVGKTLESVPIALAVAKSLKFIENEFPPPGKRKATTVKTNDFPQRNISKASEGKERIRKELQKYSQIGQVRKKLFSMSDYVQNRNRSGVKLPERNVKSMQHHVDLNISKVKLLKTKMGQKILKQEAKRKTIEDLKKMLNPSGQKLKKI